MMQQRQDQQSPRPGRGAHLPRWRPGQSGNPKGRPKGIQTVRELLAKISRERAANGGTRLEAALRRTYDLALEGTPWAVQFIVERLEGRVPQALQVDQTTQVRGPITMNDEARERLRARCESYLADVRGAGADAPGTVPALPAPGRSGSS